MHVFWRFLWLDAKLYQVTCSIMGIFIFKSSKVGDRSRGWPKGSLSIATTPKCRGGRYSITRIARLYICILTLSCWLLSKVALSTIFWVLVKTRPGIEPGSPRPLTNIVLIRLKVRWNFYLSLSYHIYISNNPIVTHPTIQPSNHPTISVWGFLMIIVSFCFSVTTLKMRNYNVRYLYRINSHTYTQIYLCIYIYINKNWKGVYICCFFL